MVGATRARTAETPTQPSLGLRLRAPYFYPTNQAANREDKHRPTVWEVPGLLKTPGFHSEPQKNATAQMSLLGVLMQNTEGHCYHF